MTNTTEVHCTVCKRPGARWVMRVDGGQRLPVHKPCGERIKASAPKGRICKVYPSQELKQEWDVRDFWADKFKSAVQKHTPAKAESPPGQPKTG
ncbi:hypothetical protein FJY93_00015 [Candidatus Kaiserbacteria bacterium]|nr:hypothetical protein [Candidatus Kaiserbacteria bacterium]